MVTESTKCVLAIIVSFGGTSGVQQWNQRLAELLAAYASGKAIESQVVS
jgi:hypothetical protein